MPQLEFTTWLHYAIVNWAFMATFLLAINSPIFLNTFFAFNFNNITLNQNSQNWPWFF